MQAGRGRGQTGLAGLVVEGSDHLLEDADFRIALPNLVGGGEEQTLEVVDPRRLVGAAHLPALGGRQETRRRQVHLGEGPTAAAIWRMVNPSGMTSLSVIILGPASSAAMALW